MIAGLMIRNKNGEVFLATGKKWQGRWVVVGGHIEPGETILEGAAREGLEETGLQLKPVEIFHYGEMINPPNFHRPAHFVHFDCLFEAMSDDVRLLDKELTEYKWVTPQEALEMNLNPSTRETIKAYIQYLKGN